MEESKKKSRSMYVAAAAVVVMVISVFTVSSSHYLSSTVNPTQQATGIQVGYVAPDFVLVDTQKGEITKETFQGKPLVIYFMATSCVSCYIGVENLASYYDQSDKNFNVLLVSADGTDTASKLVQFEGVYGRPGWYISSGVPSMVNTYHVTLLDTKYIIGSDGILKWKNSDILDAHSISDVMKRTLGV
jgi:cytochrome oxidase Cu insertion factor (SCO1/SenC/PrrC family)